MNHQEIISSLNENIAKCNADIERLTELSKGNEIGTLVYNIPDMVIEQMRCKQTLEIALEIIEHPGRYEITRKYIL